MLSSVPITIGGEKHTLQFTPLDIDDIETEKGQPLVVLMSQNQIQRIGTLASFLYVGLKNGVDTRGNPIREIPQTPDGRDQAREFVHAFLKGQDAFSIVDLGNTIFSALAAAEWFNLKQIKDEAAASVPQKVEPSKNSEEAGSKPTNL